LEQNQEAANMSDSRQCFEKRTEHTRYLPIFGRPDKYRRVEEIEAAAWSGRIIHFERFEQSQEAKHEGILMLFLSR
jgi:hypothetical protein